ncbi:MAG: biotin--[acetyl-CoA-carboxylase] ligase [Butyrivibrio sp.]|nr:biotin--[acetyl-CoA-carboxylase] ligase [Butyrivibrio sp.]
MLSSEHIKGQLHTKWAACNIVYKEVTGSTNDDAAALAKSGAEHGTLVVADRQETGRGSRGRGWETPAGTNIAMSLILRPVAELKDISMLTLIMGLSVAEAVDECLGRPDVFSMIKWPNDVVLNSKKICGILTELHMNPENTISDVVIGVGINVNMTSFPDEIKEIAGSILSESGKELDRSAVVARCMERFEENYEKYNRSFDLTLLKESYEKRLINKDRRVRVLDPEGEFEAEALGITTGGALVVRCDDGEVKEIGAGEVSVRGLYTYA